MTEYTPRIGRVAILDVQPVLDAGLWPTKATFGESLPFSATVLVEGHSLVGASLHLTRPAATHSTHPPHLTLLMTPHETEPDLFTLTLPPGILDALGEWSFHVEAWVDPFASWLSSTRAKLADGQDVSLEMEEGARILDSALTGATLFPLSEEESSLVESAAALLRDSSHSSFARLDLALSEELEDTLALSPLRLFPSTSPTYPLWVDRARALFGSWYELFPRSEGADLSTSPPTSGSFATASARLPAIAAMGFDVLYLPPIHPIGLTARKGPDNTPSTSPLDPGVPWAIGSPVGGHDAVHPDLGSLEDFDAFVACARDLDLEIALDLALQTSPDHPWTKDHPEWFTTRPDGSIAYAENPPKKYQDIVPLNFDHDPEGLYAEVLRIVLFWISHGVSIFRVDNPHTKPLRFWEWLIHEVHETHPEVIFLAEAFTRPAMLHALAKVGFSQSYTYFTWRDTKADLIEYMTELTGPSASYLRPNFFTNTPDILPRFLQSGGPPAFRIRALLASLLSPSWGVYAGFELCEATPLHPAGEEYLHSEKYELRPRDWAAAEEAGASLAPFITRLNSLRREHPALQELRNLTFHSTNTEHVLAFSKRSSLPSGDDTLLVVVNLDPFSPHEDMVHLDLPALGLPPHSSFLVHDELSAEEYTWSTSNYVHLDPALQVAHVFTLRPSS